MPQEQARTRVMIVGGGCAGLSAAWELARFPDRYEIHVIEKDWRLGGKGASGRDGQGRIVEHGLHLWLGFYENAFRMVRECYAEVEAWDAAEKKAQPLTHYSFADAFVEEPHIGVGLPSGADSRYWSGLFAPTAGIPGDPLDEDTNPFTLSNYLMRCFMLLKALSQSVLGGAAADSPRGQSARRSAIDMALDDPSSAAGHTSAAMIDTLAQRIRSGMLVGAGGLEQAFRFLELWARRLQGETATGQSAMRTLEAVASQMRKQMGDVVGIDPAVQAKMEVIDLVMTIALGLYRDRVLFGERGLDAINDIDYKAWLRKHGATESVVESQFVNGIYDLTFAFRDGDRTQPSLAAGVALRGALRMFFTYRGAMFWRLRSGMGDAVFAPMYRVLRERGVEFHFMHELTYLTIREQGGDALVERLEFNVSPFPKVKGIAGPDEPLDPAGCWPHIDAGASGRPKPTAQALSLARGTDFDAVVLALPIESLRNVVDHRGATWIGSAPPVAKAGGKAAKSGTDAAPAPRALREALPPDWQKALRFLTTAATQSAQVWMREDLDALGWKRGSTVVTALDAGFQTWADMTHTLPREAAWRKKMHVDLADERAGKSVAYLCGVVKESPRKDSGQVEMLTKELDANLMQNIEDVFKRVFPAFAKSPRSFTLVASHSVANLSSSGRYTLSEPGTIRYRLSPLDRTIANAALAGDWTACGLDAGCVESAVISGMLAAHAITGGEPSLDSIVGYDHP